MISTRHIPTAIHVFVASTLFCTCVRSQTSDESQIVADLKAGLNAARLLFSESTAHAAYSFWNKDHETGAERRANYQYAFEGEKHIASLEKLGPFENIKAINELYAFKISRSDYDPGSPYSLAWMEELASPEGQNKLVAIERDSVTSVIFGGYWVGNHFTWDLINRKEIKITGASIVASSPRIVKTELEVVDRSSEFYSKLKCARFILEFDASRSWSLCSNETFFGGPSPGTAVSKLQSIENGNSLPLLRKLEFKELNHAGDTIYSHETQLLEQGISESTDLYFFLSDYGLPEPVVGGGWVGPWVWFAIVGVICLGFAILLISRRNGKGRAHN